MKTLTTVLLLFLGVNGFGQKDSLKWNDAFIIEDKGLTLWSFKPDTIHSILMCADTSFIKGVENWIFRSMPDSSKDLHFSNRIPYVFWIFGYAIYPLNGRITYLDENKKVLKKSTVVFMSINR